MSGSFEVNDNDVVKLAWGETPQAIGDLKHELEGVKGV